jgi:hypothetical protein
MRDERAVGRAAGESVDVVARTYHTENGVEHLEGESYAVTDRALAETLRGIGFVSIDGWTEAPLVAPTITTLTPATVTLGAPDFTLQVAGTGFSPDSVIVGNGVDLATTVVSDTEVTTAVSMATATEGVVPVQVRAGGNLSNTADFTVTAVTRSGASAPEPPRLR